MSRTRAGVALAGLAAGALLIVALAGCGGSGRVSGPFGWLRPETPPTRWRVARTRSGTMLAYPPGWTRIKSDPGTASVGLRGPGGRIDSYLNATPTQGTETLANWSRFRPRHNREEGDRDEHLIAATAHGRFRSGRGACVIDTYTTAKATYREIACLVSGPRSSAVVVAAAPSALWRRHAATLHRAVTSFVA